MSALKSFFQIATFVVVALLGLYLVAEIQAHKATMKPALIERVNVKPAIPEPGWADEPLSQGPMDLTAELKKQLDEGAE